MARLVRPGLTAALVIAGCIAVACGGGSDNSPSTPAASSPGSSPGATAPTGGTVRVTDDKFSPERLTIARGSEVTWNWNGKNPHTVVGTFNGKKVQSPTKTGSGTFSFTFDAPGTYNYYCSVHGKSMSGTVRVQ